MGGDLEIEMHVFLTGANGWIGSAIARDLIAAGHTVTGLVRSPDKSAGIVALGGSAIIGSLDDLDALRRGAEAADGVIHTAFGLDIAHIGQLAEEDPPAIETFGQVLIGSDRPRATCFSATPSGPTANCVGPASCPSCMCSRDYPTPSCLSIRTFRKPAKPTAK